jgi:hypothetical protein
MRDSRELKKGMTCEMMKAAIHVTRRMLVHEAHPTTVWSDMCLEPRNRRKKTKRPVTEAYRQPRKIRVGIMNEKDAFLYTSWSEPNAGDVMYWLPVYA